MKYPRAWWAKGLVKAKCFVGDENGRRGAALRTSGVKAVQGFVGFAALKPFEGGQTAVGFVGKWPGCSKWPLWVVGR